MSIRFHVNSTRFPVVRLTRLTCTRLQPNGFHFCWHSGDNPEIHVPHLYYKFIISIHICFHAKTLDDPYSHPCRLPNTLFSIAGYRFWMYTVNNSIGQRPRSGHTPKELSLTEGARSPWPGRTCFKQFACPWNAAFSHILTIKSMLVDK